MRFRVTVSPFEEEDVHDYEEEEIKERWSGVDEDKAPR
jgi:hypothetical protein